MNFNIQHKFVSVVYVLIIFLLFIPYDLYAFDLAVRANDDERDVWELSIEENVNYPIIPFQLKPQIRSIIQDQYNKFCAQNYNVKLIRDNEAIMITIPISELFIENTTEVEESFHKIIYILLPYLKIKEMYRIIFAMHHDETLNSSQADEITHKRVFKLIDEIAEMTPNASYVIPYSMGNSYPITKNSLKNKRLEIFILPGQTMLELAIENKL